MIGVIPIVMDSPNRNTIWANSGVIPAFINTGIITGDKMLHLLIDPGKTIVLIIDTKNSKKINANSRILVKNLK